MDTIIENECRKSPPPLAGAIAVHPFVQGMKAKHLKRLREAAMFKQFEPDEIVFREGEPAKCFYLICSGKIALKYRPHRESAPLVQFVGKNEILGWSWVFPPYQWHFDAQAIKPTSAIFFDGTRLRAECEKDPAFGYDLMKRMAAIVIKRLQFTRTQLRAALMHCDPLTLAQSKIVCLG
jgi:CRP/FNR family transcriptional regulator, cyclic AMP receptor protein